MKEILDSLKESIEILEEGLENGTLDTDDISFKRWNYSVRLSEVAKELEKVAGKVIIEEALRWMV